MTVFSNSHEVPAVYKRCGINLNELGCVMLGLEPFEIRRALGHDLQKDLFWHPDPERWWIKGPVGESKAHVTLLYGLVKTLFTDSHDYFGSIDDVMTGWEQPETVRIAEIVAWTPPDGGPYRTIVGKIAVDPALQEAHERLSFMPHVDTFPTYAPHVTLAYVREPAAVDMLAALRRDLPTEQRVGLLDYGHGLAS